MEGNRKNNRNYKNYGFIGLIIISIFFFIFFAYNKFNKREEINYPLRRRNAFTEKEIKALLRKLNNLRKDFSKDHEK
jgi:hypothetical protein